MFYMKNNTYVYNQGGSQVRKIDNHSKLKKCTFGWKSLAVNTNNYHIWKQPIIIKGDL